MWIGRFILPFYKYPVWTYMEDTSMNIFKIKYQIWCKSDVSKIPFSWFDLYLSFQTIKFYVNRTFYFAILQVSRMEGTSMEIFKIKYQI